MKSIKKGVEFIFGCYIGIVIVAVSKGVVDEAIDKLRGPAMKS